MECGGLIGYKFYDFVCLLNTDLSVIAIVLFVQHLSHSGRVTHICVGKLTIIGSDRDLSPGRRQAIIWTNTGFLLIWPLRTNVIDIPFEIHIFIQEKVFENIVCEAAAILSRS